MGPAERPLPWKPPVFLTSPYRTVTPITLLVRLPLVILARGVPFAFLSTAGPPYLTARVAWRLVESRHASTNHKARRREVKSSEDEAETMIVVIR